MVTLNLDVRSEGGGTNAGGGAVTGGGGSGDGDGAGGELGKAGAGFDGKKTSTLLPCDAEVGEGEEEIRRRERRRRRWKSAMETKNQTELRSPVRPLQNLDFFSRTVFMACGFPSMTVSKKSHGVNEKPFLPFSLRSVLSEIYGVLWYFGIPAWHLTRPVE